MVIHAGWFQECGDGVFINAENSFSETLNDTFAFKVIFSYLKKKFCA